MNSPRSLALVGVVCLAVGFLLGRVSARDARLAPTPAEQVGAWVKAGFSEADARRIVVGKHFGAETAGLTAGAQPDAGAPPTPPADGPRIVWTTGTGVNADLRASCEALAAPKHAGLAAWRDALEAAGPPWSPFVKALAKVPEQQQPEALYLAWRGLCRPASLSR